MGQDYFVTMVTVMQIVYDVASDIFSHKHNTMAMTEKQHEKLQVCENNWVRRIVGVKRIDKRRMEELREEVGV